MAAHARLFAGHGYPVRLIAGRGASADPRIEFRHVPQIDSRAPAVEEVNRELGAGRVTSAFHALVEELAAALEAALIGIGICIAHNVVTLHKNLALTTALHRLARARRVRVIAWCHDFAWNDPIYADALHSGEPWELLRQPWPGVKYVVVSQTRRGELARLLGIAEQAIEVVTAGIDPLEFLGMGEAVAGWVRQFKLLEAAPLLLLPARVTRRKNIELAIEIVAALRERGAKPKLLVMGPLGPHNPANRAYFEELRALEDQRSLENEIIFLQEHGTVSDAARRDLYTLSDALLFPSEREGFGIPLLEAGLVKLPVFCADIPVFRETAREDAYYFDLAESPPVIAERMMRTLQEEARYRLKRRVLDEYSWERLYLQCLEPLVLLQQ